MSTRERWIVYPLLFLALGTAIKPKLASDDMRRALERTANLSVNRLKCTELQIVGTDDEPRIIAYADEDGGRIHVVDNHAQTIVALRADAESRTGVVQTLNRRGRPQVVMQSTEDGGEFVVYNSAVSRSIGVGHRDGRAGFIETNVETDKEWFLPTTFEPR